MINAMQTRTIAMLIALAATTACKSRDPQMRDTPSTASTAALSSSAPGAPSDSNVVPHDTTTGPAPAQKADSAAKTDSAASHKLPQSPAVKAPARKAPASPKPPLNPIVPSAAPGLTTGSTTSGVTQTQVPAPQPVANPDPAATAEPPPRLPFAAGEQLEYQVKFGSVSVGKAVMEVMGTDTVRGIPALHIRLRVEGKLGFLSVKDLYESWIDTRTMSSLRYTQDIDEATYERERHYEIYPDRKTYHETGKKELPSVAAPLDDASFLFFLRTIPLVIGQTLSFDRYFKPDRNPVKASVMRVERITVPAGKFETVVVRPVIKTSGLFSEGGRAEAWFATDSSRILVQLKTQMKVGSLNLFLRKVKSANTTP
jgi:hypothetical protein